MQGIDLIRRFEQFAPRELAVDRDPVGLQIGDIGRTVHKVMTTLDVRPEVVDEAIANNVDFIFAHHPVMFRPAKNLNFSNPQNRMYAKIIENHITVYSAHTNLDNVSGGMNDWLAEQMDLLDVRGLVPFGNYNGHPYYMGRLGKLPNPISVQAFAEQCKLWFHVHGLRLISHHPDQIVHRVAVLGGDGGKFYHHAIENDADVYVTGDVYYHTGHDMLASGLNVVDPGHNIEKICIPYLKKLFTQWAEQNDWSIDIIESQVNTDPFTFI